MTRYPSFAQDLNIHRAELKHSALVCLSEAFGAKRERHGQAADVHWGTGTLTRLNFFHLLASLHLPRSCVTHYDGADQPITRYIPEEREETTQSGAMLVVARHFPCTIKTLCSTGCCSIPTQTITGHADESEREPIDALEVFEVRAESYPHVVGGLWTFCPSGAGRRAAAALLLTHGHDLNAVQHLRDVTDPEHPYTLEQLNVVSEDLIDVRDAENLVR